MANGEHLAILEQGVETWNKWRKKNARIIPDLSGADLCDRHFTNVYSNKLKGLNLDDANLRGTKLCNTFLHDVYARYADLTDANLVNATVLMCNFVGANFHHAALGETDFAHTVLWEANFSEARLESTRFTLAWLGNASFENAVLEQAVFGDNDLSRVRGLESVQHRAPSIIGIDTIYVSKGRIPDTFLRGCGVPENLIHYIPSLVNSEDGLQFYSCFISYSSKDKEFAARLHGRMRDAHLRVWFAPEEMKGGNLLIEQIETAIRVYDKLLIVLSEASLQSEWVMTELRRARKAECQSGKRKLFPVRLVDFETLRDWECFDADSGTDLAVELREYFIPDFSNWKDHDSFEAAFSRLLKDLRAEESAE